MKKENFAPKISSVIICIMVLFLMASCKEKVKEEVFNGYIINGTVKELDNVWVKLIESNHVNRQKINVLDSVRVTNGTFKFKGDIVHPDAVMLSFGNKFGVQLFLENTEIDVNVIAPTENGVRAKSTIKGSKLNDLLYEHNMKVSNINNAKKYDIIKELRAESRRVYPLSEDHPDKIKMLKGFKDNDSLIKAQQKELKDLKFNFIKEHPSSPVSAYVLFYIFKESQITKDEMSTYYHLLKRDAKNTATFRGMEKKYKEIFESLAVGVTAPDFTLPTVEGKSLTLSAVKTKYKLVDFWASWCKPCRASFPHLKELYKKYNRTNFDIVGIGTADDEAKWRKAINDDKTVWNNLYDSNGTNKGLKGGMGKVALKYGVTGLPTTFLLDENDKIILRNPTKEELDSKLKELLGH